MNPDAAIIESSSDFVSDESLIKEKRVLVIEDGPTVTHGEVGEGIGAIAARRFGASKIIDPRPYAKRSIRDVYAKYNSLGPVLPAIGYSKQQMKDLEETVNSIDAYSVILGTPVNLSRIVNFNKPAVRIRYEIREVAGPTLQEIITKFLA
jgi:predicted GTPase